MSEIVNSRRFKHEKSNFSQTCTLLSQYLKEKGTFGDLSLGMNRNFEPNGVAGVFGKRGPSTETPTMNLFPQKAGFGSTVSKERLSKKADVSVNKSETESSQMTIFYGGQVIVFDDLPADKAKEIMLLASKSYQDPNISSASDVVKKTAESNNLKTSTPNVVPNFVNNVIQECVQRPRQPIAADLPIARKASLTRFLEKRKDRVNARAPYQIGNSAEASPKPAESNSWIGMAALQMNRQS